ncbi:MAG: calcium-binding protein [Myxococcota bacterium]
MDCAADDAPTPYNTETCKLSSGIDVCILSAGGDVLTCDIDVGVCDAGASVTVVNYKNSSRITAFGGCKENGLDVNFCCAVSDSGGAIEQVLLFGTEDADERLAYTFFDGVKERNLRATGAQFMKTQIEGRDGNDNIYGSNTTTSYEEILMGGVGWDSIHGNAGDDELFGGSGNDTLKGGDGDDVLKGGAHDDYLEGGAGADILHGEGGIDTMHGDLPGVSTVAGNDTLFGGNQGDFLYGGEGDDEIHGGSGDDELYGENGADALFGDLGNDKLYGDEPGQSNNDTLRGNRGNDTLEGGAGDDWLHGGEDDDVLLGEDGEDKLFGSRGNDVMNGGSDADVLCDTTLGGLATPGCPTDNNWIGGGGFDTAYISNTSFLGCPVANIDFFGNEDVEDVSPSAPDWSDVIASLGTEHDGGPPAECSTLEAMGPN